MCTHRDHTWGKSEVGAFEGQESWLRASILGNRSQKPLPPLLRGTASVSGAHPLWAEAGGRVTVAKRKSLPVGPIWLLQGEDNDPVRASWIP